VAVFETERLIVRDWTEGPADVARVYDIYSRTEVVRWLGNRTPMTEPAQALERIRIWAERTAEAGYPYGLWAVEPRDGSPVAGSVLLRPLPGADGAPTGDTEVGWHFHPDSWGRGYATEAARGAVARAFAAGIAEVYAVIVPGNGPSTAVTRRLGMEPLGSTDRWYGMALEAYVLRGYPADPTDAADPADAG
jgi:RimJ/RimL family protein N-acetyltransferase